MHELENAWGLWRAWHNLGTHKELVCKALHKPMHATIADCLETVLWFDPVVEGSEHGRPGPTQHTTSEL